MEPISLSTAAIAVFPLMLEWMKERKSSSEPKMEEFMDWLTTHYSEMNQLLKVNRSLSISIKAFLVDNHSVAMEKLEEIHHLILNLYASNQFTKGIIHAIDPKAGLSEQSISILKQMNDSGASKIIELNYQGRIEFVFSDGTNKEGLEIIDRRFLIDDIDQLVKSGFLLLDYNGRNNMVLQITRLGGLI